MLRAVKVLYYHDPPLHTDSNHTLIMRVFTFAQFAIIFFAPTLVFGISCTQDSDCPVKSCGSGIICETAYCSSDGICVPGTCTTPSRPCLVSPLNSAAFIGHKSTLMLDLPYSELFRICGECGKQCFHGRYPKIQWKIPRSNHILVYCNRASIYKIIM